MPNGDERKADAREDARDDHYPLEVHTFPFPSDLKQAASGAAVLRCGDAVNAARGDVGPQKTPGNPEVDADRSAIGRDPCPLTEAEIHVEREVPRIRVTRILVAVTVARAELEIRENLHLRSIGATRVPAYDERAE